MGVLKQSSHVVFSFIVFCFIAFIVIGACGRSRPQIDLSRPPLDDRLITPPVASRIPHVDTLHGEVRVDNYFWLRDKTNKAVIDYLEEENRYTEAMMKHTEKFQEALYRELVGRIKETDLSVPTKVDDYYYYSRTEEGKQYRIYCRKRENLETEEEILLDQNQLAQKYEYCDIGVQEVSPDHRLLAYSVDTTGGERFTLFVKDLAKNELFPEEIPNTGYSLAWANDNKTIFYVTVDEAKRPYKLYRHTIGTDPRDDVLVYHEPDDAFFLYVSKAKDERYLFMELSSHTTSECRYADADAPMEDFKIIHPRQPEMEYYVEHHGKRFFIYTNDVAKNFKVMEAPESNPSKEQWREVIGHREAVKIDGMDVFKDHMVVYEREGGLKKIRITNLKTDDVHMVDFPEPVYTFWQERNPEFDTDVLRFNYTSLVTPRSVYDYNMNTKTRELMKQYEVLGGYDPSHYQSERVFATADDGTLIPISMVYKRGMVKDAGNPLLLTGYGAYGSSTETYFSSNRLSLLDRGFIYAIAHVRGGGEMGRYWYEQGKLLNKMNTFTDFIACAEHLIDEKFTSSDKLVISGGSAGGLLIGAVTNMRPALFRAVIADVPFVDLINTMVDSTLPLTVIEYEEWGNPHEKTYYDYMNSYSPYDNVKPQDYPHILILAGLNDPRVMYWEPAKWTAKLRALKTDQNRLLLRTKMGTGHLGASGRYDYLRDIAFEYSFILDLFGLRR